jgi:hypothetical protein
MLAMVRKFAFLQIILALSLMPAFNQDAASDSSYFIADTLDKDFGLFTSSDILNVALWFDITHYTSKKPKEEYLDAILTYYISKDDSVNKEIRLKSRGEFRNDYCSFPPLVLNFNQTGFSRDDLRKLGKVKLVTHCETGNEENVFKEYLVYRLYNELTDSSFRVRLLRITYHNTYKNKKPVQAYGFFIEPLDLLAERLNVTPVELPTLSQKNIKPEMMDRVAVFNYMIGNTDWSVPNQHNCKILIKQDSERPDLGMIVPYDFDYSGLVNARYAIPVEGLNIETVRERIYQGMCRSEDDFIPVLKEFSDRKAEFYRVIQEFNLFNEKTRKDLIRYLDEFYRLLGDRKAILNELLSSCKEL